MMLTIKCKDCDHTIASMVADSVLALTPVIGALIVACHATHPHCRHKMEFILDGQKLVEPFDSYLHTLLVRCGRCGTPEMNNPVHIAQAEYHRLPAELVSACVIAFHTDHEGHPLEIFYDGRKIHPPEMS